MIVAGLDVGVLAALLPLLPDGIASSRIPRHDIAARRSSSERSDARLNRRFGMAAGVSWVDQHIEGASGSMRVRIYSPPHPPRGTLLYLHGGGLVLGTVDGYAARCAAWAAGTGLEVVVPEYRLAPEHPYPAAIDDAEAALRWCRDRGRGPIVVAGDSAGGGLAAALTLRNRDRQITPLACSVLVYPMLDNRTVGPDPRYTSPFIAWSFADNTISWQSYLNGAEPAADSSPAHADDLFGLPPTYLDTGTLDIFHDEDVAYARRMIASGVEVEAHIWNGAPHGFDVIAPCSSLGRRAWAARFAFVRSQIGALPT